MNTEHKQTRSTDDQWQWQWPNQIISPYSFSQFNSQAGILRLILYQIVCSIVVLYYVVCCTYVTILHINTLNLAGGEHQRLVGAGLSICQIIN